MMRVTCNVKFVLTAALSGAGALSASVYARFTETATQRFWGKVDQNGPIHPILGTRCWMWTAATDHKGYGRFNRRLFGTALAHRIAYILAGETIPDGLQVDHRCHNHSCVNTAHLRLATNKQNSENRIGADKDSVSGVRGVSWNAARNRWHVMVGHNKQTISFGHYVTLAEAEAVAKARRRELFTHNDVDRVAA